MASGAGPDHEPTAKLEVKLTDRAGSSTSEKLSVRLKR